MTPEELAALFKRRGDFDTTRKSLLNDFQNSSLGKQFTTQLNDILQNCTDDDPTLLQREKAEFHRLMVDRISNSQEYKNVQLFLDSLLQPTQYMSKIENTLMEMVKEHSPPEPEKDPSDDKQDEKDRDKDRDHKSSNKSKSNEESGSTSSHSKSSLPKPIVPLPLPPLRKHDANISKTAEKRTKERPSRHNLDLSLPPRPQPRKRDSSTSSIPSLSNGNAGSHNIKKESDKNEQAPKSAISVSNDSSENIVKKTQINGTAGRVSSKSSYGDSSRGNKKRTRPHSADSNSSLSSPPSSSDQDSDRNGKREKGSRAKKLTKKGHRNNNRESIDDKELVSSSLDFDGTLSQDSIFDHSSSMEIVESSTPKHELDSSDKLINPEKEESKDSSKDEPKVDSKDSSKDDSEAHSKEDLKSDRLITNSIKHEEPCPTILKVEKEEIEKPPKDSKADEELASKDTATDSKMDIDPPTASQKDSQDLDSQIEDNTSTRPEASDTTVPSGDGKEESKQESLKSPVTPTTPAAAATQTISSPSSSTSSHKDSSAAAPSATNSSNNSSSTHRKRDSESTDHKHSSVPKRTGHLPVPLPPRPNIVPLPPRPNVSINRRTSNTSHTRPSLSTLSSSGSGSPIVGSSSSSSLPTLSSLGSPGVLSPPLSGAISSTPTSSSTGSGSGSGISSKHDKILTVTSPSRLPASSTLTSTSSASSPSLPSLPKPKPPGNRPVIPLPHKPIPLPPRPNLPPPGTSASIKKKNK